MSDCVRQLCILSIFSGVALSLTPEGGVRRVLQIVSSVVLLAVILNGLNRLDLSDYAVELAKYREKEQELTASAAQLRDGLNRLVIEDEYAAYIEDKAAALNLSVTEVRIGVSWSMEGVWVPETSYIRMKPAEGKEKLSGILEAELGISAERQEWDFDE